MEKQWRETDAVSRTVLQMNTPDLGRFYQHPFKPYHQAGHSICMKHDSAMIIHKHTNDTCSNSI